MSHKWTPSGKTLLDPHPEGPPNVRIEWVCERCGASLTAGRGEIPDPDEVFWKGVGSEVETCEEMLVDMVHDL